MDKLKMHSPDLSQENIAKIRELFPGCVTEARDEKTGKLRLAVDFDQLRQELSGQIVEGPQERYRLDWPGKREALATANAPIAKALRPCISKSSDFETTQNLFIEGDNLEALKLVQESYLGKVGMIFIDPPYNTGNDFVYDDDFVESYDDYLIRSNQRDATGSRLLANPDTNGRFHSDWLSMMYPRLRLARNLLRDDGVIFITIDDGEVHGLKQVCDEVFGENNFIANLIWQKKFSRANDAAYFSTMHDHILCYAKNSKRNGNGMKSWELQLLPRGEDLPAGYGNPDNDTRGHWTSVVLSAKSGTEKLKYEIITPSGRKCLPPDGRYWGVSEDKFAQLAADNRIWFGKSGDGTPRLKTFLSEVQDGLRPNTIWLHSDVGHNQEGRQELKKLFEDKAFFDSPKPVRLLKTIVKLCPPEDDFIVMDFFAGSGTTAHAVMEANAEDGAKRRYVVIQLPEALDENSDAYREGFQSIADVCRERIRRAGQKVLGGDSHPSWNRDVGFRVLKVDTSNMKDVYYRPDQLSQADLFESVDNVKPDRTAEDLLFQVLVDWGVDLTLPIRRETLHGKTVFFVDDNALVACFDQGISEELVKELAKAEPLRVVFRDNGFASDALKINVEQIFRQLSPSTEVRTL
ncbi:site-specific DNA-methyltransferase [Stutzerimonas sp. Brlt_13]|uniref:site-specific DNA-methyltransferase n=1 Tax=unclassified Stutzerimonas TaxID=2901165 RepID=UPI003F8175C1